MKLLSIKPKVERLDFYRTVRKTKIIETFECFTSVLVRLAERQDQLYVPFLRVNYLNTIRSCSVIERALIGTSPART